MPKIKHMDYDVVIAGGSVAGLLCAREIAGKGHSVLVIEEDSEIGTPEHCGGVVSIPAMDDLGIIPVRATLDNKIRTAKIVSPSGKDFTIYARPQQVIVLDRREFDKQIAHQAQVNGAEIRVRSSLREITKDGARTSDGEIKCKIVVDARGVSSLIQKDRTGTLQSAQYEVFGDWIDKEKIEVYLDQEKYPGYVVTIGDAAGQAKPTTAGGIYTSGIGGILAGNAISKFLESGNKSELLEYQKEWNQKFGKEFENMLLARSLLERLDNKSIDAIFESITPKIVDEISKEGSFDFHTTSVAKLLGVRGSVKAIQAILGNELRRLLN